MNDEKDIEAAVSDPVQRRMAEILAEGDELATLKSQNEILKCALEFYADTENWMENDPNSARYGRISLDYTEEEYSYGMGTFQIGGKRAREALKKAEEIK